MMSRRIAHQPRRATEAEAMVMGRISCEDVVLAVVRDTIDMNQTESLHLTLHRRDA